MPAGKHSSWLAGAAAGALPPVLPTLVGAVLWGAAMGATALLALAMESRESSQNTWTVVAFFAVGGFVAFPLGITAARFLSHRRSPEVAFASAFLSLGVATVLATGGFYALDYRSYYAEWHADAWTRIWILQFTHTIAAAFYQFAVLGLRLYFPFGFIALVVASTWFARRVR